MLITFLGNPGTQYALTRHNVAWILAENLPLLNTVSWQKKFKGEYAKVSATQQLHLLKPLTFMNFSGQSLAPALAFFNIEPKDLLVIHDELEVPHGTVSLKWAGGLGGHNGLRSIKAELGTADFWRLRIGIGRPVGNQDIANFVLSRFTEDEMALIPACSNAVQTILTDFLALEDDRQAVLKQYAKYKYTENYA